MKTIGVAYDESESSEVALAHAALLAADLGANLRVHEVVELHVYGAGGWGGATAMVEEPEALATAARERMGSIPGAEVVVGVGPVRAELLDLSDEVDLRFAGRATRGPRGAFSWAARATT